MTYAVGRTSSPSELPATSLAFRPFAATPEQGITRYLSGVPISNCLLAKLPQDELDELRPYLARVRLVTDQVLIECGRPAEHAFFLEDGLASLVAEHWQAQPGVQVAMIGKEGMVGALSLLDEHSDAYASVVMHIPGVALRIPVAQLRRSFDACPVLRGASLTFIQSLARHIMSIAAHNARDTLIERCASWLLMAHERIDGDDLSVTHEALSTMLGVRRSGVTVATAALQKAGLIQTGRGRIRIINVKGLEAITARLSQPDGPSGGFRADFAAAIPGRGDS